MKFEPLDPNKHDHIAFNCGVEARNQYLLKFANQDQKRNLSKVYVLAEKKIVIGYYSISAHSVLRNDLPVYLKIGNYTDIPFLLLGRLAVDKNYQGQGYGDALIYHAFKTTIQAAETIGILGVIVDAKDENAASFYEGFGFIQLAGNRNRLVLPLASIKSLLAECEF